jgi:hypothetical protein
MIFRTPFVLIFVLALIGAQQAIAQPKSVPRMQALPLPDAQIAFQRDGVEIARYHFGPQHKRPFLFPLVGPAGRSLTRMGHPHDPVSHSHHNSVWISHHDLGGVDFWGDTGKGRIVHQRVEKLTDEDEEASVTTRNAWIDEGSKKTLLWERRRVAVQPLDHGEWLLVLDLHFEANKEAVTFGKTPFGLFGVRMAKTIGVNDGGGTIRNSSGLVDEKNAFWKPAKWVDYSGPIIPKASEGITLFDHPSNPNHPSVFHVRNDGWMGASLTFDGPLAVEPDRPLRLRYGVYVHAGQPSLGDIEARWTAFTKTAPSALFGPLSPGERGAGGVGTSPRDPAPKKK